MDNKSYILHDITTLDLDSSTFAENLNNRLKTIDCNFKKIIHSDYLKGPNGNNLYSKEFTLEKPLIGEDIEDINFNNINEITSKHLYNALYKTISNNIDELALSHISYNGNDINWFDSLEGSKIILIYEEDKTEGLNIVKSSLIYIFNDERFKYVSMQDNDPTVNVNDKFINLTDLSCAVYYDYSTKSFIKNTSIPTIYLKQDDINDESGFYWVLNGEKTNIPAQGPAGLEGTPGHCYVVKADVRNWHDDPKNDKTWYNITHVQKTVDNNGITELSFVEITDEDVDNEYFNIKANPICICIFDNYNKDYIFDSNGETNKLVDYSCFGVSQIRLNGKYQVYFDSTQVVQTAANTSKLKEILKHLDNDNPYLNGLFIPADLNDTNSDTNKMTTDPDRMNVHKIWSGNYNDERILNVGPVDHITKFQTNNQNDNNPTEPDNILDASKISLHYPKSSLRYHEPKTGLDNYDYNAYYNTSLEYDKKDNTQVIYKYVSNLEGEQLKYKDNSIVKTRLEIPYDELYLNNNIYIQDSEFPLFWMGDNQRHNEDVLPSYDNSDYIKTYINDLNGDQSSNDHEDPNNQLKKICSYRSSIGTYVDYANPSDFKQNQYISHPNNIYFRPFTHQDYEDTIWNTMRGSTESTNINGLITTYYDNFIEDKYSENTHEGLKRFIDEYKDFIIDHIITKYLSFNREWIFVVGKSKKVYKSINLITKFGNLNVSILNTSKYDKVQLYLTGIFNQDLNFKNQQTELGINIDSCDYSHINHNIMPHFKMNSMVTIDIDNNSSWNTINYWKNDVNVSDLSDLCKMIWYDNNDIQPLAAEWNVLRESDQEDQDFEIENIYKFCTELDRYIAYGNDSSVKPINQINKKTTNILINSYTVQDLSLDAFNSINNIMGMDYSKNKFGNSLFNRSDIWKFYQGIDNYITYNGDDDPYYKQNKDIYTEYPWNYCRYGYEITGLPAGLENKYLRLYCTDSYFEKEDFNRNYTMEVAGYANFNEYLITYNGDWRWNVDYTAISNAFGMKMDNITNKSFNYNPGENKFIFKYPLIGITKINNGLFNNVKNQIGDLIIDNRFKIESIGSEAFKESVINSISLNCNPNKFTIGSNAFEGSTTLTELKSDKGNIITKELEIGDNAFNGCSSFGSLSIDKSKLKNLTIGSNAFNGCENLKSNLWEDAELDKLSIKDNAYQNTKNTIDGKDVELNINSIEVNLGGNPFGGDKNILIKESNISNLNTSPNFNSILNITDSTTSIGSIKFGFPLYYENFNGNNNDINGGGMSVAKKLNISNIIINPFSISKDITISNDLYNTHYMNVIFQNINEKNEQILLNPWNENGEYNEFINIDINTSNPEIFGANKYCNFKNSPLGSFNISMGISTHLQIPSNYFENSKITSFSINTKGSNDLLTFGTDSFKNCKSLQRIGEQSTNHLNNCFYGCDLLNYVGGIRYAMDIFKDRNGKLSDDFKIVNNEGVKYIKDNINNITTDSIKNYIHLKPLRVDFNVSNISSRFAVYENAFSNRLIYTGSSIFNNVQGKIDNETKKDLSFIIHLDFGNEWGYSFLENHEWEKNSVGVFPKFEYLYPDLNSYENLSTDNGWWRRRALMESTYNAISDKIKKTIIDLNTKISEEYVQTHNDEIYQKRNVLMPPYSAVANHYSNLNVLGKRILNMFGCPLDTGEQNPQIINYNHISNSHNFIFKNYEDIEKFKESVASYEGYTIFNDSNVFWFDKLPPLLYKSVQDIGGLLSKYLENSNVGRFSESDILNDDGYKELNTLENEYSNIIMHNEATDDEKELRDNLASIKFPYRTYLAKNAFYNFTKLQEIYTSPIDIRNAEIDRSRNNILGKYGFDEISEENIFSWIDIENDGYNFINNDHALFNCTSLGSEEKYLYINPENHNYNYVGSNVGFGRHMFANTNVRNIFFGNSNIDPGSSLISSGYNVDYTKSNSIFHTYTGAEHGDIYKTNLSKVVGSEGLKFGAGFFEYCNTLTHVLIDSCYDPSEYNGLARCVFRGCSNLEKLILTGSSHKGYHLLPQKNDWDNINNGEELGKRTNKDKPIEIIFTADELTFNATHHFAYIDRGIGYTYSDINNDDFKFDVKFTGYTQNGDYTSNCVTINNIPDETFLNNFETLDLRNCEVGEVNSHICGHKTNMIYLPKRADDEINNVGESIYNDFLSNGCFMGIKNGICFNNDFAEFILTNINNYTDINILVHKYLHRNNPSINENALAEWIDSNISNYSKYISDDEGLHIYIPNMVDNPLYGQDGNDQAVTEYISGQIRSVSNEISKQITIHYCEKLKSIGEPIIMNIE